MIRKIAARTSDIVGSTKAFFLAILTIVVWGAIGPFCGYSDTWQLVINTGTTIVTFLMMFLLQNTQNRDNLALQAKLDELIRCSQADNAVIKLEKADERTLKTTLAKLESKDAPQRS